VYARQQFKCAESIDQHCLLVTSINKSGNMRYRISFCGEENSTYFRIGTCETNAV